MFPILIPDNLSPAPIAFYDVPVFSHPKVHRDHPVEVLRAIWLYVDDTRKQYT